MTTYAQMAKDYVDGAGQLKTLIPEAWAGFSSLHGGAVSDGLLSKKVKELIAVAIGISDHCSGCIALHTKAAIHAGVSREEFAEMISVALLMGGGPASVYGIHALEAYDEFSA